MAIPAPSGATRPRLPARRSFPSDRGLSVRDIPDQQEPAVPNVGGLEPPPDPGALGRLVGRVGRLRRTVAGPRAGWRPRARTRDPSAGSPFGKGDNAGG
eukprot:scaffold1729_cov375-Prasinococcus_capsulatus_cf.AAC.4